METNHIFISKEEAGTRIDKLLSDRFDARSRSYFQYLIDEGFVLLNGSRIKKRILPKEGDEVEIFFQLTPQISLEPEDIPLNVLYEDEHILAVNKPVGMVTHPAAGHRSKTFVNALLFHCKDSIIMDDTTRPGIVHRLDKNTSGVLIAAKTTEAHQRLISAFSQRKIEKQYFAVCCGKPKQGTLSAPIGRHIVKRKEMTVVKTGGREAISEIQIVAFNESHSLVLVSPKTGRTHQIRVHLKHLKAPIVGDEVYGKAHHLASRQLLHAYRLKFDHPITHVPMEIIAPIPEDMKSWIKQFSEQSLIS